MKVHADPDACVSSGLCVLRLPELFDQSEDDGTVVLLRDEAEPDEESTVLEVVRACPSRALRADP
nr:ferredoxin [uncultured bacterium]